MIGIKRTERDASQVVVPVGGQPFGMVIRVPYGPVTPIRIDTESDYLNYFTVSGKPNPSYKDYYEGLAVLRQTPILVCRPQGDALYGGILVEDGSTGGDVIALNTGITDPNAFNFNAVDTGREVMFAVFGADPSADNNLYSVEIAPSSSQVANTFDLVLYYDGIEVTTFNVSTLRTQLDGFGNNVYIEEVMKNRSDVQVVMNPNWIDTGNCIPATSAAVNLAGGVTATAFDAADTMAAWDNFKEFNKYYTHYLVDTSADATVGAYVDAIANSNFYQFAFLAVPSIKMTNPRATETLQTWFTNVSDYRDVNGVELGLNSDHSTLCSNWARVTDPYNNTSVWISPASLFASRKAFTINNISISQAAVGANSSRGVVASEVIELEQDVQSYIDSLAAIQVNAITYSPAGPTCWGEWTQQTLYSNTSFVSHRNYFLYLEETIESNLFYFVFTDINDETRAQLKTFVESFTRGEIGINAEDIQVRVPKDDALANLRKMKVQVAVIPYPKANEIVFEFIHGKTGVDLNEIF